MTLDLDAVSDCKYATSLGELALQQFLDSWAGFPPEFTSPDYQYWCTLGEIKAKLGTTECLLG